MSGPDGSPTSPAEHTPEAPARVGDPEGAAGTGAEASSSGAVESGAVASGDDAGSAQPSGPAAARPVVRPRRSGPLTRMGPWAPVAGGLVGVVLGVVATVLLAGTAHDFRARLALVFLVVGLGLLGASGTLLADEVRLVRWRAERAAISPDWVEATAGLLNGLTPARLLLLVAGFVLFLSAFVAVR